MKTKTHVRAGSTKTTSTKGDYAVSNFIVAIDGEAA